MYAAAGGLTGSGSCARDAPDPATLSRPRYRMRKKEVCKVSEQQNKELMKQGYAAFSAGDVDTVMSLFDDDVEWVQPGQSAVSGTFHGKTEVLEFLGRLAEKSPAVKLIDLIAEGDTVVALTEVSAGGEIGRNADVFTVRDGKTVRVLVHGDTALMERVYGKKALTAG